MKKALVILTILMCFVSIDMFSQEVRGIETKRVYYTGGTNYLYNVFRGHSTYEMSSNVYYGWEFANRNSCAVSVDISLFCTGTHLNVGRNYVEGLISKKSIVLEAGESYVFKFEGCEATKYFMNGKNNDWYGNNPIDSYYVEYKAFKLQ